MKLIVIILLLTSIITSCQKTKKEVSEFEIEIASGQLKNIIIEYNQKILSGKDRAIITLTINNNSDTTILFISSLLEPSQEFIMTDLPSFFTTIDNRPVLVYSGFEKLMSFNKTYIKELEEVMDGYMFEITHDEGEAIMIPPNYNPIVWKMKFFNNELIEIDNLMH